MQYFRFWGNARLGDGLTAVQVPPTDVGGCRDYVAQKFGHNRSFLSRGSIPSGRGGHRNRSP